MAPAYRTILCKDLHRVLDVGTWNVLNLLENRRLPHLSNELRRVRMDMVGHSETRRQSSDKTSSKGFTNCWSGMNNGHNVKGAAIGISSRLQLPVVEDSELIMRVSLNHNLGFMPVVAVYAPTEKCETEEKELFYAKLDSVLDQSSCQNALIVFNAVSGTERAGYELCLGAHSSVTRNDIISFLLNLARSKRLIIAGSWY